jgi:hypothetical protein
MTRGQAIAAFETMRQGQTVIVVNPDTNQRFEILRELLDGLAWYSVLVDSHPVRSHRRIGMSREQALDWLLRLDPVSR